MHNIIDSCFLCIKDYNCVAVDDRIISEIQYLLPEITIIKLGVPLRICSLCDGNLSAFSRFKQFYLESSRLLEASITSTVKKEQPECTSLDNEHVQVYSNTGCVEDSRTSNAQDVQVKQTHFRTDTNQLDTDITCTNMNLAADQLHSKNDYIDKEAFDIKTENLKEMLFDDEQLNHTSQDMEILECIMKSTLCANDNENNERESEEDTTSDTSEELDDEAVEKNNETDFTNANKLQAHKCSSCNKIFVSKDILEEHIKLKHVPVKEMCCNICNKVYTKKESFRVHMKTHSKTEKIVCHICNKHFTRKVSLQQHMKLHIGTREFKCEICEKSFLWKKTLVRHMYTHSGVKEFKCTLCNKSFAARQILTRHMLTHTREKKFECSVCHLSFSRKLTLEEHMKSHMGTRDFQCEVCKKSFIHKKTLVCHMLTHSGVRKYTCSVCDKSFSFRQVLNRHMITHTGEKKFQCFICHMTFTRRYTMNKHIERHSAVKD